MKAHVLHEPELEFRAGNRHIDPRYGISVFGPADADSSTAPHRIPIGMVGPAQAIDGIQTWLLRCRERIEAKATKSGQENLHQPFPGFNAGSPFGAELVFDDSLVREIPERQLRHLARADVASATSDAVGLYQNAARSLAETGRCRVVICARPEELTNRGDRPPAADRTPVLDEGEGQAGGDFHDRLKAAALTLSAPLQLMRKETWTGTPAKTGGQASRPLQDEATRAWNLHTALYYKAGGTPWRMQRHSSDMATCYVGVSFYRTAREQELHTAVAQVFNERGDGVVVRGGTAQISKSDLQPHLPLADARRLLLDALSEYRSIHGHQPARIVVHKTSNFTRGEIDGFHDAADERDIDHVDMLWIQRRGAPHLYRTGQLPPLRGTTVQLDASSLLLYTRGSVPYFRTYPGMYVPQPLLIRSASQGTDPLIASTDILALSKMNWNNAQLDERDPLTLRTAYRVGSILKYVPGDARIAARYAYYM
jgi:hypothetical protein